MAAEIARGKKYFPGWNTARWFLSHESFQRNPERFLANLESGMELAGPRADIVRGGRRAAAES